MAAETTCSAYSQTACESLFGTVKPTRVWLLLEYDGRWQPQAVEHSEMPILVKAHLTHLLDTLPQARLLLIRQKPRVAPDGIAFYVAVTHAYDPRLYAFSLTEYEDMLALDIPALVADPAVYETQRHPEPLALVCTHGRRDPCCARQGVPVYEQLVAQMGARVWQASHVGGHSFAANVLFFPHGLVYGRVTPDNVGDIAAAYHAGHLVPDFLRGCTAYESPVQAAETLLRLQTGITDLAAFQLVNDESSESGIVRFVAVGDGSLHTVQLAEIPDGVQTYASCGDAALAAQVQYRLVRHTVESH